MKPKIDITITDTNGAYASLADGIEPYEVYVNNEPVCTSERPDELESENAKLRERMEWLEDELRKQGSASITFMEMIGVYQEDNKKLRELVRDMRKAFFALDIDHCQACPRDTINGPCTKYLVGGSDECSFEEDMRELGIEVH